MRKSLLTLMIVTALALAHVSVFALTPIPETNMKTPTAQAGFDVPIEEPLDRLRIIQVFYTNEDQTVETLNVPSVVNLNEGNAAMPGGFSAASRNNLSLKDQTPDELKEEPPSIAIDEITRINDMPSAPPVLSETNNPIEPPRYNLYIINN